MRDRALVALWRRGTGLVGQLQLQLGPSLGAGRTTKAPKPGAGSALWTRQNSGSPPCCAAAAAGAALPEREQTVQATAPLPTRVDEFGACSVVASEEDRLAPSTYENVDGRRVEDGRFAAFQRDISEFIPLARQYTDPVRTFAYGTDASFYRLVPKLVLKVLDEEEVRRILPLARKHGVPVTFRAAGTSLSGQAITDSVLLKMSHNGRAWRSYQVHGDGSAVTVQPALLGGEVNRILAQHQRKNQLATQYKLGPDPASIDSAMVGGILANNASGMCCGVAQNSYHTLADVRLLFADGTLLDTADPASRSAFLSSESGASLARGVSELAREVQADRQLASLIRRKYAIKNTTGLSINALVDFPPDDPIEIIKHLMVGSEGTLAFISQATYLTVPESPHKASAFVVFPDVVSACQAASMLRRETSVDAAELFDRAALRQFEDKQRFRELVPDIVGADPLAAGLLIECRGQTEAALAERIAEVEAALAGSGLPFGPKATQPRPPGAYQFTADSKEFKVYWDARKQLLPIVAGVREPGTTMMLEDVACPVDRLGEMTLDLVRLMRRHGYDACIFGHALEGNVHICFSQGFRTPEEVHRFGAMFEEMMHLVAVKHGGSLKGEHGTGRNVAPFVELEWGTRATQLMWRVKQLFDPENVLNPGVVLNKDPLVHLKHLKPSPVANPIVDRCLECAYCEPVCPSRDITLTPRQRIVVFKEMRRLSGIQNRTPEQEARLAEMRRQYEYDGSDTCAADGMCEERCPVRINTGDLIKELRSEDMSAVHPRASRVAQAIADHFGPVAWALNKGLTLVSSVHGVLGPAPLQVISSALNRWTGHMVPEWNHYMPKGAAPLNMHPPKPAQPIHDHGIPRKVVYVPACVTRIMGPARDDPQQQSVHEAMLSLFDKAGYEVIYPEGLASSCCGMMFGSRGFKQAAAAKGRELEAALLKASEGGKLPIVCDTSPCLSQIKGGLADPALRFSLYEPGEFIRRFLADKLEFRRMPGSVAVHVPCSSKKMGVEDTLVQVAAMCADQVVSTNIPCCGMAGDRGLRLPELTEAALQHLDVSGCQAGVSSSRTCEVSLSNQSGIHFRSLVNLVDAATQPKGKQPAGAEQQQVVGA